MKKFTIVLTVLIGMTIKTNAQIPNNGFEDWTTVSSYEDPTGWGTPHSFSTGSFYSVTKSIDHYPNTVGAYSVRIENNTALLPNYSGLGLALTGTFVDPHPVFQIIGHPTSLTGYYKYAPQNGDTMCIGIALYMNGSAVSYGMHSTTASVSSWTSFNIPLSDYTTADSGHIFLASYYAHPGSFPQGNSILYVDNLSFDTPITSLSLTSSELPIKFNLAQNYPNPFNPNTTIKFSIPRTQFVTIKVFDLLGREIETLVNEEKSVGNYELKFDGNNLTSGVYFYRLQAGNFSETNKMILMK